MVIDEDKIQKDQFKNYIHIHVLLSFQKHSLSPASNTYHDLNRILNWTMRESFWMVWAGSLCKTLCLGLVPSRSVKFWSLKLWQYFIAVYVREGETCTKLTCLVRGTTLHSSSQWDSSYRRWQRSSCSVGWRSQSLESQGACDTTQRDQSAPSIEPSHSCFPP